MSGFDGNGITKQQAEEDPRKTDQALAAKKNFATAPAFAFA